MDATAAARLYSRVRYIGNKTRLLGFITDTLRRLGLEPGRAVDPFTGTASVARALKRHGWRVTAGDIMHYGYVFARAYVALPAAPPLAGLGPVLGVRRPTLARVVRHLEALPPESGFVATHFAPAQAAGGRRYFTAANAGRIDAIRRTLHEWRTAGHIADDAFHLLLAALIEGADAVANTTGVYAAWVKQWQPNALRPLALRPRPVVRGNGCHAVLGDAQALVASAGSCDLLYLDPPYNERQYPGYYHLPELIAAGWFDSEPDLRGKTGLIPDAHKRSDWSRRGRCEAAFERLIAGARCRHILLSYNSEGIIPERTIERVLRDWGRPSSYRRFTHRYRRYRSDADGERRRYRGDAVDEILHYVAGPAR
jgi:adenine-specific DNA-methyltransferase